MSDTRVAEIADAFASHAPDATAYARVAVDIPELLELVPDVDPVLAAKALGYGTFLPRVVRVFPQLVSRRTAAQLDLGPGPLLAAAATPDPALPALADLRRRRNRGLAGVALAAMTGRMTANQVWETLSDLADVWIDEAYRVARAGIVERYGELRDAQGQPAAVVILGFGKLGSRELNFSSDVDLVFVGDRAVDTSDGGSDGAVDAAQWQEKLCRRVVQLLDTHDDGGFVYRVDLRLRPDGTRGHLVPRVDAFLDYYPNWSSTWERIALLRARPVGGDRALGDRVLGALSSYVYPRHLDFESLTDMRRVKEKIDREAARRARQGVDLKLGPGGIREVEFLVQNLQIIFGGRTPSLRTRGTLAAVTALVRSGVVPNEVGQALGDAYTFLRHVENMLQARDDRQTQLLSDDAVVRGEIARACGFGGGPREAAAALTAALAAHGQRVSSEFHLLYRRDQGEGPGPRPEVFEMAENDELSPGERERLFERLGFVDTQTAATTLERLRQGPKASVYGNRAREQFERLLPLLLEGVVGSPNPDQALTFLHEFVYRIGGRPYLYALLRENPQVVDAVATLFAGSTYLARFFIRHPELLDALVLRSHAVALRDAEATRALVRETVAPHDDDPDAAVEVLRRLRMQETLRIGWHDLIGSLNLLEAQQQLSDLAAAILEEVRHQAFRSLTPRCHPSPTWTSQLLPVALGKLGSGELNYLSDLDLIFLIAPGGDLPIEFAVRWAQKMITMLTAKTAEGTLYAADMRLRPSGNQGLLVTTFAAFADYHREHAEVWERVALLKHRVMGGGPEADAVQAAIAAMCYDAALNAGDVDELDRIRDRMIAERGDQEAFKAGAGGTADIEFAAALAQICFGRTQPSFRVASPRHVLGQFATLPSPFPSAGSTLLRALYSYRLLESRVHLLLDRPLSRMPDAATQRTALARAIGFTTYSDLMSFYTSLAQDTRAAYIDVRNAIRTHLAGMI